MSLKSLILWLHNFLIVLAKDSIATSSYSKSNRSHCDTYLFIEYLLDVIKSNERNQSIYIVRIFIYV